MTRPPAPDTRSMRERMVAGGPYIAEDPELAELSLRALDLMAAYSATSARDPVKRRGLLEELLAAVGDDTEIRPPLYVDYGRHLSIGARCFANFGLVALDVATMVIGDDVQMGPNVQLLTPTHPVQAAPRRAKWEAAKPITIGDNVWLGGGAIVLPGVTIGENTVVGAGAVVAATVANRGPPRLPGRPPGIVRAPRMREDARRWSGAERCAAPNPAVREGCGGKGLTVADEHDVRIVAWPDEAARVEHAIGGDGPLPVRVAFDSETPATVIVATDERPLDVDMRMRVSAKEPVPLSIRVRDPICATSDYTVGIAIFDNPVGTIRVRGETKFALCSDRPEPVETCTDFRNLVAEGEFPTPVTHGKLRFSPLGEPLRSVSFGDPAGQTKLAFPPTGVRVEFPQTVRGVRLVIGGYADPQFRFSVYGPGGRIGDFTAEITNETRTVEVPHSGVSAVEIRGGGNEAFLVEVCATPQQL